MAKWTFEPELTAFVKPKSRDGSYPSLDSYPTRSKPKAEGVNVKRPSIVKRHVNKSPNIPLELYRPTVLHLDQDRPSLLAVCLASRRLNAEGKRVLYRRMDISQNAETAHMLFFTTILSQKPLALLVEEYRQPNDGFPRYFRKDPLWDLVHHGLKAMVNLKWLSLETLDQASNRRRFVEILRGCAFQLEFFEWYNVSHDEETDFLEFLASQPRLRVLLLPGLKNTSTPIPPRPRLETLRGNRCVMDAFLPGRRIVSLKWMSDHWNEHFDSIAPLSQSLKEINFLSLGGSFGIRPSLVLLCPHLRSLEVLELIA